MENTIVDGQALGNFVDAVGQFYSQALDWVGETLTVITGNPALLVMCVAIPIAGVAIGYLGRIFRVG